jgi:transcriptional repressor NrdR
MVVDVTGGGNSTLRLGDLGPLRELDEVACLRFASVYRGFESLAAFEDEIASLRSARQSAATADAMVT